MRLSKVTLTNFRCFEHLELDLHPRLTVIVGANGAGKTAVLDGIAAGLTRVLRYLSSANQRLSAAGADIEDKDFRLVQKEGRSGSERWGTADFAGTAIKTTSGLEWDHFRASSRGKGPATKMGEAKLAAHLATIADGIDSNSPSSLLPVFAYYGAGRGRIEIPERLRATKENYSHPTSALVGALDSLSDFKEMLKWFDDAEATELRANKGQLPEDFELSPALEAVRYAVGQLLGGEYQNPHFNRDHRFIIEKRGSGAPFQVGQLSQGYQSMLALGMDFARRLALANPHLDYGDSASVDFAVGELPAHGWTGDEKLPDAAPMIAPAIMLVDEIDLHLHPAWQQRVLSDLMRTFPGTQFIVTTHSPQVLSTVQRECIRLLGTDTEGEQIISMPVSNTYGQPSNTVLHRVMRVDPQPPIPELDKLKELTRLIDQGEYTGQRVEALMGELINSLGDQHEQIQRLRRSIQRQTLLAGNGE